MQDGYNINFKNMIKDEIVQFIKETKQLIIATIIYQIIMSNKNKILILLLFIAFVGSFTYYLYIPKISDVEKYQQEKNVVGMCELIDKTFKPFEMNVGVDKYREVRSSAVIALAEMRDSKGVEYLEKKMLDENIWNYEGSYKVKSEIVKALVNTDNKYLENICKKYMDMVCNQKDFDEKIKIYDKLYRFSITGISEEYISAVIYKDALKSLNNNIANDVKICKYINQEVFLAINYSFSNKLIFKEYSKLVNLFSKGYETIRMREIDNELAEEQKTIDSLNYYFSPEGQDLIRRVAQQIYADKGEKAALEYINEAHRIFDENLKKLWEAWDKINKLNYNKNHIAEEKKKVLKEKNRLYDILHSWANRNELEVFHNTRDTVNNRTEIKPLGYKIGVKYEDIKQDVNIQNRGGYEIYTVKNNDKITYTDFVPVEKVSILKSELTFDKTREKNLKIVDVTVEGKKDDIVNYLDNLYGTRIYSLDEGDRYLQIRWGNENTIVVYTFIHNAGQDTNSIRIGDRKWFESQP